jgi:hypothetical protein
MGRAEEANRGSMVAIVMEVIGSWFNLHSDGVLQGRASHRERETKAILALQGFFELGRGLCSSGLIYRFNVV